DPRLRPSAHCREGGNPDWIPDYALPLIAAKAAIQTGSPPARGRADNCTFALPTPLLHEFSLPSDAGGFDDRPPLVHFGILRRGEAFRRLLVARGDVEAELGETRLHRRIGQRLH